MKRSAPAFYYQNSVKTVISIGHGFNILRLAFLDYWPQHYQNYDLWEGLQ
jgi:hypothetical protein